MAGLKILDFGLAKLTQPESGVHTSLPTMTHATEAGVVMGTAGYMSPEQVRGIAVDARSDIFSFGAILYEMLSGKRAFHRRHCRRYDERHPEGRSSGLERNRPQCFSRRWSASCNTAWRKIPRRASIPPAILRLISNISPDFPAPRPKSRRLPAARSRRGQLLATRGRSRDRGGHARSRLVARPR